MNFEGKIPLQITFIDHYDSFSFNVLEWLRSNHDEISIERITCDDRVKLQRLKNDPKPLIISPGPGRPSDYPDTLEVIQSCMVRVPVLGICLGHQMLIQCSGGSIIKAIHPWHGTKTLVQISTHHWIAKDLPQTFSAITYHSLVGQFVTNNTDWEIIATNQDHEIMMIGHKTLNAAGMQFHPESFGQDHLNCIARNFLKRCKNIIP
jgi:anthranilate synthase/aminodeoxychorismate synthase-like glutamine amidotransferase